MVTLSTAAVERSTYIVNAAFTDEDDNAVTPTSVVWTLLDAADVVVNAREQVSITPGTSVDIVLSGDDLALATDYAQSRRVIIEAVYNSDAGTGLPLKDGVEFTLSPLPYIE